MSARRRSAHGGIRAGAVPAAEPEVDGDDDAGEVVTVDYRFSILAVRRFVDKLSDEQEEVVRSMGFEGVLHLSRYSKLDRHFSAWLCNQLVVATAPASASAPARVPISLADGAGADVPVTARDVSEVLGVPNGERPVEVARNPADKGRDAAAVRRALGLDPGEAPTLQAAEAIVARRNKDAPLAQGPMTQAERDAFVVAFLLLVVEHFFAPGSVNRRGRVNEEVFHALANPSEVHLYDWAEYALEEFRRCAGRVREQVTSKSSKIALSGCLLFLQFSTVKPAQRDDFRSTSEGRPPPPHLQSCDAVWNYDAAESNDAIADESYPGNAALRLLLADAEETPVVQTTLKDVMTLEPETGCAPSCRSTETKKGYIFGPSPFEMGLVHPEPPLKKAEACFKWLEACSYADDQLKWPWIVLEEPIPIKVEGLYVKLGMIRSGELKADVCNLVMSLYHQLDDQIYQDSSTDEPRWRHFLPAEWSSSALKHGDKICESSATVRTMFSGQHITYDVGLCRMIIAPVEVEGSWSCYAWDFKEKRLNILDPLRNRNSSNEEAIKMKHSSSAPLLLRALLSCVSRYCSSHVHDHQESSTDGWETRILQDLKGMHTFHITRACTCCSTPEFDGKGLKQTVGPRTIASLRRDLVYQMLTMHGNTCRPPSIIGCPVTGPVRNQ
nr:unnamed protein product [Digitaria exilis]